VADIPRTPLPFHGNDGDCGYPADYNSLAAFSVTCWWPRLVEPLGQLRGLRTGHPLAIALGSCWLFLHKKISAIVLVCSAEILEPSRTALEKTAIVFADPGCCWLLEIRTSALGDRKYIHADDDSTLYMN
jgi:hypothetical protein